MFSFQQNIFTSTRKAVNELNLIDDHKINDILYILAKETENSIPYILSENKKDTKRMSSSDPKFDRLLLTEERLFDIAKDIRNVADLSSPIGK